MGIFKSKEEKRIERDMQIRKGIGHIKRNIRQLGVHEHDWLGKARRAKRMGDGDQFAFLKKQLKRTAAQKRLRERQLLALETAMQVKNQAEADVEFMQGMVGMSKAVSELYSSVDVGKVQMQFEKAMAQADSVKARMDIFLESINDQFTQEEVESEESRISDKDIDSLLDEDAAEEEGEDADVDKGLKDLEDELGK